MRYAATAFDLDGTLCRHRQAIEPVFDGAFADAGVERFADPGDLWPELGDITDYDTETEQLADAFAGLAAKRGRDLDARALAEAFVARLDWSDVSLLPGATAALDAARANGPVGLMTNGPAPRQSTKLDALGLLDAFDAIVYAGDMNRRKPHPDPFERVVAGLSTPAEATLYVGDSLEHDVRGARGAGLPVAWVNPDGASPGEHAPTHDLRSVGDLGGVY
ncbi:HAD family hydrolase [Halosegnis marinus]|uniref:HAD family hydrolase n=1 Tax=Halosegnis marinus TaxID=3034023 RepID=A0ABD5ZNG9_9EURY|nr:HAD family hydrolase [Halosegnis sp. DT85]